MLRFLQSIFLSFSLLLGAWAVAQDAVRGSISAGVLSPEQENRFTYKGLEAEFSNSISKLASWPSTAVSGTFAYKFSDTRSLSFTPAFALGSADGKLSGTIENTGLGYSLGTSQLLGGTFAPTITSHIPTAYLSTRSNLGTSLGAHLAWEASRGFITYEASVYPRVFMYASNTVDTTKPLPPYAQVDLGITIGTSEEVSKKFALNTSLGLGGAWAKPTTWTPGGNDKKADTSKKDEAETKPSQGGAGESKKDEEASNKPRLAGGFMPSLTVSMGGSYELNDTWSFALSGSRGVPLTQSGRENATLKLDPKDTSYRFFDPRGIQLAFSVNVAN